MRSQRCKEGFIMNVNIFTKLEQDQFDYLKFFIGLKTKNDIFQKLFSEDVVLKTDEAKFDYSLLLTICFYLNNNCNTSDFSVDSILKLLFYGFSDSSGWLIDPDCASDSTSTLEILFSSSREDYCKSAFIIQYDILKRMLDKPFGSVCLSCFLRIATNYFDSNEETELIPKIKEYLSYGYPADKIIEIALGLIHGVDISGYLDSEYNASQLHQIRVGLEQKLDVNLFAKLCFDSEQMRLIRLSLENGLSQGQVALFANPEFNREQLYSIFSGLWHPTDYQVKKYNEVLSVEQVFKYADLSFTETKMDLIRLGFYFDLPDQEIDLLCQADMESVFFAEEDVVFAYDAMQIDQLQLGITAGVDTAIYENPVFSAAQMEQIRMGLEVGIDASLYANPEYSRNDMRLFRMALIQGIDANRIKSDLHRSRGKRDLISLMDSSAEDFFDDLSS